MITVLLVDDHALVRSGIQRILEDSRAVRVVGELDSGEAAVKWCRVQSTDVVLMDMHLPGMSGLEATRKILHYSPDLQIIMLTMHTDGPLAAKVFQAGASGFLGKGASPQEMLQAIRAVASGKRYITPEIAQQLILNQFTVADAGDPFAQLSEREFQIMTRIIKGLKAPAIADELKLSTKTVNSYRYRLFRKLQVTGDVELTRLAFRTGLIQEPAPI